MLIHVPRHCRIVGLYGPTNGFEPILIPSNGMSCPFSVFVQLGVTPNLVEQLVLPAHHWPLTLV